MILVHDYVLNCEKHFIFRWILRIHLSDGTGGQWCSAFNEAAEDIIGITAREAESILQDKGEDEFGEIFQNAMWKSYIFKIRGKLDTYSVILFSLAKSFEFSDNQVTH